jgi:hypothetical protein
MRDIETIDSELRLMAALRRAATNGTLAANFLLTKTKF